MTFLWQEEKGKYFYRMHTNDKLIMNKLKRRYGFKLTAISDTHPLWILEV